MYWFGKSYATQKEEVPVPVGEACIHCGEVFVATDAGNRYLDGKPAHRNCFLRQMVGSVAHIERRCGCYVTGSDDGDPHGLTLRQAADAAVAAWEQKRKLQVN